MGDGSYGLYHNEMTTVGQLSFSAIGLDDPNGNPPTYNPFRSANTGYSSMSWMFCHHWGDIDGDGDVRMATRSNRARSHVP